MPKCYRCMKRMPRDRAYAGDWNCPACELAMGGVLRFGPSVTVTRQDGAYLVKRHPEAGHLIRGYRTLTAARTAARKIARGDRMAECKGFRS